MPVLFLVYGQYVFYIDSINAELNRFNLSDFDIVYSYNGGTADGNNSNPNMIVLASKEVLEFTISENVIYFSTFERKIFRMDIDGKNREFIVDGMSPAVLGNYLFYLDKNGEMACLPIDFYEGE